MTVKCQVLSDGFDGGYFTFRVNVNYFSEGGESPGVWYGAGAKALGLVGTVNAAALQRLLVGVHPHQFTSLVQQHSSAHCPGFDLQFSVPKSVSALWAVAPSNLRGLIEDVFDFAVRATLTFAEQELDLTRRGHNGVRREKAKLVVALFDHVTSRNGDPLLHRHCVVNNVCQRHDGTWGTIDSRTLHNWARTLGPMFRATLAHELRDTLGIELIEATTPDGKRQGHFEIAGVPESLTDLWSSRRQDLIEHLEGTGGTLGDASAKAKEFAAIQSRPNKDVTAPRHELHADWQKVAAEHGFSRERAQLLFAELEDRTTDPTAYDHAWKQALEDLTRTQAHFTERRLIQEVAEQLQTGQMTGTEIARRVRSDLEQRQDIIPLQEQGSDRCFTTLEMWELEQELLRDVATLNGRSGTQVPEKIVADILRKNPQLDAGQVGAIRTALTGTGDIRAITGVAGAGKSTTLKVVKEALERAGYEPMGLALSGVAKEQLAEATGMPCRTIASFLYQTEKTISERLKDGVTHVAKQFIRAAQGKSTYQKTSVALHEKSFAIVDEAGMADTRAVQKLVRLARDTGAKILFVGDVKQLQPIEAGAPFRRIVKEVPTAHLSVNHRQQDANDKKAVTAIRAGDIEQAFRNYAERNRIHVGENRRETIEKLVEHWSASGGTKRPADHLIFTQTRAEAAEANHQCQAARLKAAKTPHLIFVRHGEEKFYRGDRVLFHAPERRLGIENGYRGTVVSVDPIRRELKVRLDHQSQTINGPQPKQGVITVPLKQVDDISLGYACTTHKGQGCTVAHAYVCLGGRMTDNELAYVQLTRARNSTHLFVDKSHAGEDFKDLITAIEKSNAKLLAHDKARPDLSALRPNLELDR
ncbi:MobF family relaxase [Planctomicrobium sp. SH527]|uniref:MobF family relaxase n=1 Tax=Planctomicrobium sp. SH527 TaxID=3448123 RepID=UPI003F5CA6BA